MIEVASIPSSRRMFCSTARPEKRMLSKVPEPEFVAPGTRRYSCEIWRPLMGRFAISRAATLPPIFAEEASSVSSAPASTVTLVALPCTCSEKSCFSSCPTPSSTFLISVLENPVAVTSMSYVDGRSATAEKVPSSFVNTVRCAPVRSSVRVTCAFLTVAPEASVIVPTRRPVVPCACRSAGDRHRAMEIWRRAIESFICNQTDRRL